MTKREPVIPRLDRGIQVETSSFRHCEGFARSNPDGDTINRHSCEGRNPFAMGTTLPPAFDGAVLFFHEHVVELGLDRVAAHVEVEQRVAAGQPIGVGPVRIVLEHDRAALLHGILAGFDE